MRCCLLVRAQVHLKDLLAGLGVGDRGWRGQLLTPRVALVLLPPLPLLLHRAGAVDRRLRRVINLWRLVLRASALPTALANPEQVTLGGDG